MRSFILIENCELLVQHVLPSAAAEAALQHPLPTGRNHQQRQIDHQGLQNIPYLILTTQYELL